MERNEGHAMTLHVHLFSHHPQPEWKWEFEGSEISAGPRIWHLLSGEGIKVIKRNNESQRQKRKEGGQRLLHYFSRQRSQVISYISVFNLPCLSFYPCSSVELPQFLLEPHLAVSGAGGTFCRRGVGRAHWRSTCTLFHFCVFPCRLCWPVPSPGARKGWHRGYSDI